MIVELLQTLPKRRYERLLYNVKNVLSMRKGIHTQNQLDNFQPFLSIYYKLGKLLESWKILIFKGISRLFMIHLLSVTKLQKVHVYTAILTST